MSAVKHDCFSAALLAVGPPPKDGWEFRDVRISSEESRLAGLNITNEAAYDVFICAMGFFGEMDGLDAKASKEMAGRFFWWYWNERDKHRRRQAIEEFAK